MEISELLTTKPEDCNLIDLEIAISTLKTALKTKTDYLCDCVEYNDHEEAKEWLALIRCDTYMLENLVEKSDSLSRIQP